ncbi:hypothetical protein RB195_011082 [Necator americanus]
MFFEEEDSNDFEDEDEDFYYDEVDSSPDVTFAPTQSRRNDVAFSSSSSKHGVGPGCRLQDIFSRMNDSKKDGADEVNGIASSGIELNSDDLQTICSRSDRDDFNNGAENGDENVDSENRNKLVKPGENGFGANHSFLTGDVIRNHRYMKNGSVRISTNRVPYVHNLHDSMSSRDQDIREKLFTAPTKFKYGARYKDESRPGTWTILWEPKRLHELTTFVMMSTICAALNSQRCLRWVVGIGRGRRVVGCTVSNEERDTLRQAFIYCVRSGILPELHPELVHLRFTSVEDHFYDESNMRLLVEIAIDHKVATLYQLSSGRIFCLSQDKVKEIKGGINEARRLLEVNYRNDWRSVFDQAPYGYLRYTSCATTSDHDSTYSSLFWFLMKIFIFFVPGVTVGFSIRRLLPKTCL